MTGLKIFGKLSPNSHSNIANWAVRISRSLSDRQNNYIIGIRIYCIKNLQKTYCLQSELKILSASVIFHKVSEVYDQVPGSNNNIQAFSQDYELASHTTFVACINLIHEWWYDFFFRNFSWQFFNLLSEFQPEIY